MVQLVLFLFCYFTFYQFFSFIYSPACIGVFYVPVEPCPVLSLCVVRVPVLTCSREFLPLAHPAWFLVRFRVCGQQVSELSSMVPCLVFSICLVLPLPLLLFGQLMSRLSQWCYLAVSLCYSVPAVSSHVHLTTLLHCWSINPCHSLTLRLFMNNLLILNL